MRYFSKGSALLLLLSLGVQSALAGSPYQPPGVNQTLGDVSYGHRAHAAFGNPAAAAASVARFGSDSARGASISAGAGLEYGNVQEIFDLYDDLTRAFNPSPPGSGEPPPGQNPGEKPDNGIDIGDIIDAIDPDLRESINAIAREVATRAALLAFISTEGYGKAWLSADVPFVFGNEYLGGNWTLGLSWSGSSKAYGVVEPIQFDVEIALQRLQDWFDTVPQLRPPVIALSDDISITPQQDSVLFQIRNDSSLLTKSTQTTELSLGYSRPAWSSESGALYLGIEAKLYLMQLSRLSARFGDITDSEELFDAIRSADFRTDERVGFDLGALWVSENYQLGVQVTNVNEPKFVFPDVNLAPYQSVPIINVLRQDQVYRMDRQFKVEGSIFTDDRRWSAHLGVDLDPATDPMGDRFQWATLSAGFNRDSFWLPGARIGIRRNLSGTELTYVALGVTAFKFVNFDIASALDTVSIDGQDLPQGLMANIGFQINW